MENTNTRSPINIQILTPSGFQSFDGVKRYWHEKYLKFIFEDNTAVECAVDHRFIINDKEVYARDVLIGDNIGKIVSRINKINEGDYFYDPVNVGNGSVYNHDQGFVSHNTFFGTGDTLIGAEVLLSLRRKDPINVTRDNVYVYEESKKDHQYIMTVDVAKGRGQDYSTFTIIDVSVNPFKQVATYRDNHISPLLYPNIIYKYAMSYNEAMVVIESNDAGQVVCNGLYHDLEYENMFVESAVKSGSLGMLMTRKVKRIGCSSFKDLMENNKLDIMDENTILEISTFTARGQSYEASDGNHDDLVMNLILFSYFVGTSFFNELTDISIKDLMFEQRMKEIDDDIVPFGFYDDGQSTVIDDTTFHSSWAIEEHQNDW